MPNPAQTGTAKVCASIARAKNPWGRSWRNACFLSLAIFAGAPGRGVSQDLEYQVKAAFLFNFLKYIEWPHQALAVGEPMRICILGADPFGEIMEQTMSGRAHDRHALEIRRVGRPEKNDVTLCHLAFVGAAESRRYGAWLGVLRDKPILSVGESPAFVQKGGAIALVIVEDRVRFDIHAGAVERAGLSISSRILALARKVE